MKLNRADHLVILNLVPDGEYRSCVEVRILALTKYYESATHKMLDEEDEEQITSLARARFPTLPYDDLSAPRLDSPRTYAETVASRPKPGTSREGGKARQIRLERESEKSRLQTAKIYYAPRFWEHIFQGENLAGSGAHTGLHSTVSLSSSSSTSGYPKIDRNATDSNGCYEATVKLNKDKAPKRGSFFPDSWSRDKVIGMVEAAIRDSWLNPRAYDDKKSGTKLTWIGTVVDSGGVIYIGGIGGSGQAPSEAVATAFPAVNGTFK
jgi:hypothetical protein